MFNRLVLILILSGSCAYAGTQSSPNLFTAVEKVDDPCKNLLTVSAPSEAISGSKYPIFELTFVKPPNTSDYLSYRSWKPTDDAWETADPILRDNLQYYFNLLRSDPNLAKLSDRELQDSALKVMRWKLEVNSQVGSGGLARMWDGPSYSAEAGFDMEKYRLYLKAEGIDPDARPPSFQAMLAKFGYKSLAHGTSENGFFDILKHGKLASREDGGQAKQFTDDYDGSYVYLEALPEGEYRIDRQETPIYLVIDPSVLDQLHWHHFNVYWKHGRYDPGFSVLPCNLLAGFFNIIKKIGSVKQNWAQNEFLFTDEVPLSYVKRIYIKPASKAKIISQLKSLGGYQSILDKID